MRESFIISPDKNNGYPSFLNALDFENVNYYQNRNMFLTDGNTYPVFKNKNYPESEIINTAFYVDGKDYPYLKSGKFSLILGAFANCTNLTRISIPDSVKFIGNTSFRNTKLTSVEIASDCIYSPESFPDNCKINFY